MRSKSKGVPVITKQPQDQYVKIGSSAGFTVSAKPEPLRYQWQLNCNTIPGATNKTYTIPHVTTNDVGNYFCLVSREPEVTMTQPATLMSFSTDTNGTTVAWVPPPGGAGPPGPGGCPVNFICYGNFKKTVAPFGWYPMSTGAPDFYSGPWSAQHLNSSLTDVKYFAGTIQGCGHNGMVPIPVTQIDPTKAYRFTVYFPSASFSSCPTAVQYLQLTGFKP